jgi:hypothetical protein
MIEQAIHAVNQMLEQEERTLERLSKEVTADFPSVRAELRSECLRDVLKKLTRLNTD